MGNDREVALTKEFWYSPKLGINLMVKRFDPLQGTQVFTVSDISEFDPDPRLFVASLPNTRWPTSASLLHPP